MTIDEESRHRLYARLEEVLGPVEAATMMEYLPQITWNQLATKSDLDRFGTTFDLKLEAMEHRLQASITGQISQALSAQTRNIIISNASMLAGVAAIAAILGR